MEIKLTLTRNVLGQLIEQCGEYNRKKLTPADSQIQDKRWTRTHYIVLGDKYNVIVDGYSEDKITLQIKPERTL